MTAPHLLPYAHLLSLRDFALAAQATLTKESELTRVRSDFRLFFNYRTTTCAHSSLTLFSPIPDIRFRGVWLRVFARARAVGFGDMLN